MANQDYYEDDHYKSEEDDEREMTDYEDEQPDDEEEDIKHLPDKDQDDDSLDGNQAKFCQGDDSSQQDQDQDQGCQAIYIEDQFGVVDEFQDTSHKVANKDRVTSPYLSKYEMAIILGKRARQIQQGSAVYANASIQTLKKMNELQIAQLQLEQKRIPLLLRRVLPDGSFDDWKVSELMIINVD